MGTSKRRRAPARRNFFIAMQNLSEMENTVLGASAAFVEAIVLQPTIYWKNARMQGLPFTVNPRVVYRGLGAALCNEMGQMGLQFGITGYIKKLITGGENRHLSSKEEIGAAVLGGCVAALFAAPIEVTMIQQQRFGGALYKVPVNVLREYGMSHGLYRGLVATMLRDGIYVGALLGVTPVVQDYLHKDRGWNMELAGLTASLIAGVTAGVITTPVDCIKTCMAGDLQQTTYKSLKQTTQLLYEQGGLARLFNGGTWRAINITGTIYLTNVCMVYLSRLMFPDKFEGLSQASSSRRFDDDK